VEKRVSRGVAFYRRSGKAVGGRTVTVANGRVRGRCDWPMEARVVMSGRCWRVTQGLASAQAREGRLRSSGRGFPVCVRFSLSKSVRGSV
jgi:hypothetical protein